MPSIMAMASIPTSSRNLIDQQTVNVADAFALSNGKLKPHSTPATLCWLEKNYELSEGVCIPRNVVYYNYTDFCRKNNMLPVNAASFGKVMLFFTFFSFWRFSITFWRKNVIADYSTNVFKSHYTEIGNKRPIKVPLLRPRGQDKLHLLHPQLL